jgi:phosphoribosylformylglycinamidine synthase
LFVTLCESGFNRELGFTVETKDELREDAYLFGEGQSRVVVSVKAELIERFENTMKIFRMKELGW